MTLSDFSHWFRRFGAQLFLHQQFFFFLPRLLAICQSKCKTHSSDLTMRAFLSSSSCTNAFGQKILFWHWFPFKVVFLNCPTILWKWFDNTQWEKLNHLDQQADPSSIVNRPFSSESLLVIFASLLFFSFQRNWITFFQHYHIYSQLPLWVIEPTELWHFESCKILSSNIKTDTDLVRKHLSTLTLITIVVNCNHTNS